MSKNNFLKTKLEALPVEELKTEKVEIPHILTDSGKPLKATVTELNAEQRMDLMNQLRGKDGAVSAGEGKASILAVCYGLGFERDAYDDVCKDWKLITLVLPVVMRLSGMFENPAEKKVD